MASRPLPLLLGLGSAAAFAAFPLVRPWGDKSGDVRAMAEAFASPGWVIAHSSGMFAWVLLAAALATLAGADRWARRSAWAAAVGAAAVLPYYGAETFGLHGLARAALDEGNLPLVWAAQELVRGDALASTFFGLGLLLVAVAGLAIAVSTWRGSTSHRWVGIPVAVGLVTYLPQFFAPDPVRQAHGLVLGLALVAWLLLREDSLSGSGTARPARRGPALAREASSRA